MTLGAIAQEMLNVGVLSCSIWCEGYGQISLSLSEMKLRMHLLKAGQQMGKESLMGSKSAEDIYGLQKEIAERTKY